MSFFIIAGEPEASERQEGARQPPDEQPGRPGGARKMRAQKPLPRLYELAVETRPLLLTAARQRS